MPAKKKSAPVERPTAEDHANNQAATNERRAELVQAWRAKWRLHLPVEADTELAALL